MMDLIEASGWKPGDLITTITLPSGWGDSAYIWLNDDFKRLTGQNCVKFDSAAVNVPAKIDSLRKSKIIFISGGDQAVMMRLIKGTNIKAAINEAYQNGALVGGTSAGASIMSERMITGNGLVDTVYQSTFDKIWKGNLELVEGLGLLDSVIIDQHFVARSRHNRLLSAVIENKGFQCIGIDEGTAILVSQGNATVIGVSQVIEFSNPIDVNLTNDTLLSAKQIHVSVYLPGDGFPIKQ
jgi:cyanophycinase